LIYYFGNKFTFIYLFILFLISLCLAHEELAQLTEAERLALQNSNDFFEFGDDDEGEALEPEPKVRRSKFRHGIDDTKGYLPSWLVRK
jgi:hypothetical protein